MQSSYKNWSSKSSTAKKLIELFELYKSTNGAAGVNYKLNSPSEINSEVYNKHEFLRPYNPDYFSKNHFRSLRNNWQTAKAKEQGRKNKKEDLDTDKSGKYYSLPFFVPLFHSFSFVDLISF